MERQTALGLVSRVPRTATELYREWADLPADFRLPISHRRRRAELGRTLESLAREGVIHRAVEEGEGHRPWVVFWRPMEAVDTAADAAEPRSRARRHRRVL